VSERWSVEQVESIAPSPSAVSTARAIASPQQWTATGADARAVWGSYRGTAAEPYSTVVDHVSVGSRCTCASRRHPCKHALALLLLWCQGQVAELAPPAPVEAWIASRSRAPDHDRDDPDAGGADASGADASGAGAAGESDDESPAPPPDRDERDGERDDRVARMMAGLTELDRWLDDRIRHGLADPALARYGTWDTLAARLVDARAGSLANRIRRLAGLVGASPDWHDEVLAELGLLHLLSRAGRRLGSLPAPLADAVATTVGWQVRKADVLAGVPETDRWIVAGRSDQREDRIEVRRHWLRGSATGRWALVLSFAAFRQSLDTSLVVGSAIEADLHRYPGPALRAILGLRHEQHDPPAAPAISTTSTTVTASTIAGACDEIGDMLTAEPWLDRLPAIVRATPTRLGNRWVLSDDSGSLPLLDDTPHDGLAALLALSASGSIETTIEWTPRGVLPLAVHLPDRSIDIGPRADALFVGAA
jgi:hypothetical protein